MGRNVVRFHAGRRSVNQESKIQEVLREHYQALRTFVHQRVTMQGIEPEDVVQDVLTRLVEKESVLEKICSPGVNTRAYLYRMANNLMLDMLRKKNVSNNYVASLVDEQERETNTIERQAAAEQELEMLKKVILGLKPEWRNSFLLHRFGGLSYSEISARLGITVKQVENHITKCLVKVKAARKEMRVE